jgi:hypothetical protein
VLHVLLHIGHLRVITVQDLSQSLTHVLVEVHLLLVAHQLLLLDVLEEAVLGLLVVANRVLKARQGLLYL